MLTLTPKAEQAAPGLTYAQWVAANWTDALLIAHGYALLTPDAAEQTAAAIAKAAEWLTPNERETIERQRTASVISTSSGLPGAPADPLAVPIDEIPREIHIEIRDGALAVIVERMERALSLRAPDIYKQNGHLARLIDGEPGTLPTVHELDEPSLRHILSKRCYFTKTIQDRKTGAAKRVFTDPTPAHVKSLMSWHLWPHIRPLTGIIDAPTLRPDGSILQDAGYDAPTGIYAAIAPGWPRIPESPTHDDARAALAALWAPFKLFDWVDNESISVYVSTILTALIRESLPTVPAVIVSASAAGSGKSKLVNCAALIATGRSAPLQTFPEGDEQELQKLIVSAALKTERLLAFDNVRRGWGIDSAVLAMLLTCDTFSGRILGASKNVTAAIRTLVIFTGNNIRPLGDLVRRCIGIRLEPDVQYPEDRQFTFDPVEYVRQHRQALTVAALTLLRAHAAAGRPQPDVRPIGSFEAWHRTVRACVIWIGLADPVASQDRLRDDDDEGADLAQLLTALRELQGPRETFTAADVAGAWALGTCGLQDAIQPARDGKAPSVKTVGRILAGRIGHVAADLTLRSRADKHAGSRVYWVSAV